MHLPKISPQSSCTQGTKSFSQSLLILKKSSSNSKKDCIEFDFQASCENVGCQNWSVSQLLPVFNRDNKFYTPTFILKMDKEKYELRDKIYRSLHQERIQSNIDQETSDLRVPKPFKFNSYCIVCKKQFLDYQKHINSKSHTEKMLQSQFCHDIDRLCQSFGNLPQRQSLDREMMKKTKRIVKMAKKGKTIQNVETKCEIASIYQELDNKQ